MRLTQAPSGPPFVGVLGDVLVCQGGDQWAPGPGGGGGGGGPLETAVEGIPSAPAVGVVAPWAIFPGTGVLTFASWAAGDILRARGQFQIGTVAFGPANMLAGFAPTVSVDGGATYQNIGVGLEVIGAAYQFAGVAGDIAGSTVYFDAWIALPAAAPPLVRLAYGASATFTLGGPAGGGVSQWSIQRYSPVAFPLNPPVTTLIP
jgi:hypothetical protein